MRWIAIALTMSASPAFAFDRVTTRDGFLQLVQGNQLKALGVRLQVGADGSIRGRAFGHEVTGDWRWQDGYFCRTMEVGGDPIELNCQEVNRKGNRIRFQSDRGTGESATLRID